MQLFFTDELIDEAGSDSLGKRACGLGHTLWRNNSVSRSSIEGEVHTAIGQKLA